MRIKGRKREPSPETIASPIGYAVPVGESGSGRPLSARTADSVVQLYAFEKQHAAFQRIAAKRHAGDLSVASQRVRIRTGIGPDHRVIAAQGETSTVLKSASGRTTLLRELAYTSDLRRAFLSNVSRFFGEGRRIIPQFDILDAFGSRLRAERDRSGILEATAEGTIERLRETGGRSVRAKRGLLPVLEERLRTLAERARPILAPGFFEGLGATVSDPGVASATALDGASERTASLTVSRLAAGTSVASDAVADAGGALGLEGEFFVNDVRIEVEAGDGLGEIARRILRGEDLNGNGILDNAEDRNHNRILDDFEDANGNGVLDTGEDGDGDGVLDRGEDLNYNGRLDVSEDRDFDFKMDGGVAPLGIDARIDDKNRLVVTAPSADVVLRFRDPDGVLRSIGLLEMNVHREWVPAHPLSDGHAASLSVDGRDFAPASNRVEDAIPSVRLQLLNEGKAAVTVDRSFGTAALAMEVFADAYNDALFLLNEALSSGGLLDAEPSVGRIRIEFAGQIEGRPALAAAGVEADRDPSRLSVHELQLSGILGRLRDGVAGAFDRVRSPRTAANSLESLGISRVEDGRIRFDAARFSGALRAGRGAVRDVLAGDAGAVRGILETAQRSIDPETGRLRFLDARLARDPQSGAKAAGALAQAAESLQRTAPLNVIV